MGKKLARKDSPIGKKIGVPLILFYLEEIVGEKNSDLAKAKVYLVAQSIVKNWVAKEAKKRPDKDQNKLASNIIS